MEKGLRIIPTTVRAVAPARRFPWLVITGRADVEDGVMEGTERWKYHVLESTPLVF